MKLEVLVRLAILLGVLNLLITVSHVIHDAIEFADIRVHIDQFHPGFEK